MQCNGDKTDCQDGSQLGRRESGRTTDSGAYGSTTHIRHSHAEGYAYAEGYVYTEGYAYAEGYAYGFTTHIRHGYAESLGNSIT